MIKYKNIHGIILDRVDYKDTDGIFTVFTKEYGKMSFLARGIKKSSSKLGAFLQTGAILTLELVSKSDNLPILKGAKSILIPEITDYDDLVLFAKSLQTTKRFCHPEHVLEKVFWELSTFIAVFCKSRKKELLVMAYALKLMTAVGFLGDIKICHRCHHKLPENNHVLSESGVICYDCHKQSQTYESEHYENPYRLSFSVIKVLAFLQHSPFVTIEELAVNKEMRSSLSYSVEFLLTPHLL